MNLAMVKTYSHLFFDLDNTIFDFTGGSRLAFSAMLKYFNIKEEDDMYDGYKRINKEVWNELEAGKITQYDLREKRFKLFFNAIKVEIDGHRANSVYLSELVEHSELLEGARELLTDLKKEYVLFAITNGLKEVQRPRMNKTNTTDLFDHIVVSDEIGFTKPHKAFFDVAYEPIKSEVTKDKILVIGDSLGSDIKGGNDYGFDTCHYNPRSYPYLLGIEPVYKVHSFDDLRSLLLPN